MFVYRYMGKKEMQLMTAGMTIGGRDHTRYARTISTGVCFLPEAVHVVLCNNKTEERTPENCICMLSGIVSSDKILVKFYCSEKDYHKRFYDSFGVYADPYSDCWYDYATIDEICCESYNRDWLNPVAYALPAVKYTINSVKTPFNWYQFN